MNLKAWTIDWVFDHSSFGSHSTVFPALIPNHRSGAVEPSDWLFFPERRTSHVHLHWTVCDLCRCWLDQSNLRISPVHTFPNVFSFGAVRSANDVTMFGVLSARAKRELMRVRPMIFCELFGIFVPNCPLLVVVDRVRCWGRALIVLLSPYNIDHIVDLSYISYTWKSSVLFDAFIS